MIKNKVNIIVGIVKRDTVLAPNKSKPFAQLQQKVLKIVDQEAFQLLLCIFVIFRDV